MHFQGIFLLASKNVSFVLWIFKGLMWSYRFTSYGSYSLGN